MNIPLSRGGIMKKMKKLSFVFFIFSVLGILYIVPSVSAQGNALMNGGQSQMSGGQCDPNPACDPTSGTCCNQCDPGPACVASDPNAIPCCGGPGPMDGGPNDQHMSGSNDHGGPGPNDHGDPCMNMPPGPAQAECYKHKNDHRGPNDHGGPGNHPPVDISHCANMPPDSRPGCEEAAHRAAGGPGNHPPLDCPPGSRNPLCAPGGPNDHRGPNDDMRK